MERTGHPIGDRLKLEPLPAVRHVLKLEVVSNRSARTLIGSIF